MIMMTGEYRAIQLVRFARGFRQATDIVALPLRDPGPGEIRVRNRFCGINGIFDTQVARNAVDYITIKLPTLTGVEAIGVVESVGDGVGSFRVGDAAVSVRFGGGYREANIGPAENFVRVPAVAREWLALSSTGVSALLALEHVGALADGETVAISAAAGGLGHFLVQLAKRRGCRVVAVCGGAAKAAFVKTLGADRVIDYRQENLAGVLAAEFRDAIDVAVDTVGGAIHDAFLDNLAPHGRLVVGGAAADMDGTPEIVIGPRVAHKIYFKGASVRGFMNGRLTPLWPMARDRIFGFFEQGYVRVTIDEVAQTGLEAVYEGVDRLLGGHSMGKVMVRL